MTDEEQAAFDTYMRGWSHGAGRTQGEDDAGHAYTTGYRDGGVAFQAAMLAAAVLLRADRIRKGGN